jgi:hypothetical protein
MQKGVELKSHTDQHTDPSIHYATIIYINDDYVDGELFFPNKDISLRPKPGDLLFFPGNEEYRAWCKACRGWANKICYSRLYKRNRSLRKK